MSPQELQKLRETLADPAWHTISALDAVEALHSHYEKGLSTQEAQERLAAFGPNELREAPRPTLWARLLDQLKAFW